MAEITEGRALLARAHMALLTFFCVKSIRPGFLYLFTDSAAFQRPRDWIVFASRILWKLSVDAPEWRREWGERPSFCSSRFLKAAWMFWPYSDWVKGEKMHWSSERGRLAKWATTWLTSALHAVSKSTTSSYSPDLPGLPNSRSPMITPQIAFVRAARGGTKCFFVMAKTSDGRRYASPWIKIAHAESHQPCWMHSKATRSQRTKSTPVRLAPGNFAFQPFRACLLNGSWNFGSQCSCDLSRIHPYTQ